MKYHSTLDLFWAIVWTVVLILAIVGLFWNPALYLLIAGAVGFSSMFFVDFIRIMRMK